MGGPAVPLREINPAFLPTMKFLVNKKEHKMTLLTYRIFKTVSESGSFHKTADLLGLTPSAISHTISGMEKELGQEERPGSASPAPAASFFPMSMQS